MCAFGTWIPKKEPFENRWFTRFFPWVCTSPISQPSATRGLQIAKDDVAAIRWLFSSGSFRDQGHKPLFVGCKGSVGCLKQLEAWKKQQIFWRQRLLSSPLPPPQLYTILFELLTTVGEISHIGILFDLICRRPSKSLMKMAAVTSMFVSSQTCCAFRAMLPASMRLQPNLEENRDNGETIFFRENRNKYVTWYTVYTGHRYIYIVNFKQIRHLTRQRKKNMLFFHWAQILVLWFCLSTNAYQIPGASLAFPRGF